MRSNKSKKEYKKVSAAQMSKIVQGLAKDPEKAIGNYMVGDSRVQVLPPILSTAQRVRALYKRRRDQGLCIQCSAKVKKRNPYTGKLYRLCEKHRKEIDHMRTR